jgi:hypothetical protein
MSIISWPLILMSLSYCCKTLCCQPNYTKGLKPISIESCLYWSFVVQSCKKCHRKALPFDKMTWSLANRSLSMEKHGIANFAGGNNGKTDVVGALHDRNSDLKISRTVLKFFHSTILS